MSPTQGLLLPEAAASLPLGVLKCSSWFPVEWPQLLLQAPLHANPLFLEPASDFPQQGAVMPRSGLGGCQIPLLALSFFLHLSPSQGGKGQGWTINAQGHGAVGPGFCRAIMALRQGVTQLPTVILHLLLGPGPHHGCWSLPGRRQLQSAVGQAQTRGEILGSYLSPMVWLHSQAGRSWCCVFLALSCLFLILCAFLPSSPFPSSKSHSFFLVPTSLEAISIPELESVSQPPELLLSWFPVLFCWSTSLCDFLEWVTSPWLSKSVFALP